MQDRKNDYSSVRTMAKDWRKAFVAAYTATVGPGPTEERDPMNRMRPPVWVQCSALQSEIERAKKSDRRG